MKNSADMNRYKKTALFLNKYGIPGNLFLRLLGAYFTVSAYQFALARKHGLNPINQWKDFVTVFELPNKLLWVIVIFLVLSVVYRIIPKKLAFTDQSILIASVMAFSLCIVWKNNNYTLAMAIAVVAAVFSVYAVNKMSQEHFKCLSDLSAGIIVFTIAAVVIGLTSLTTIANHLSFGTQCYDMGIFVQTFHSLKEHFNAVVTCERSEIISHFRVHGSYIFYLLFPIYALFPKAETLLAMQAFFSIAGVVPLFLIARKHGLKSFTLVAMCLVYVFCRGLIVPCYFDFHENAFLPTVLMWLLYAADQKKILLFYIMSIMTCMVKEDAPLYVICIALFFFCEEKTEKRKHGVIIAVLAAVYFILIMKWLNNYGDGEFMTTSRFEILMLDNTDGFIGILHNIFVNPGYFFSLFLQDHTLYFFIQTMFPILFLPFLTKELHHFWLLIPYVVMNLVIGAGYIYAADFMFQYILGPSCLLIYMILKNLEDFSDRHRNMLIISAAIVTMITTTALESNKLSIISRYRKANDYYKSAEACIKSVPENASVLADNFLLPHVANRDQIYVLDGNCFAVDDSGYTTGINNLDRYDFCVLNKKDSATAQATPFLEEAGWTVFAESEGDFVIIYVSPDWEA